MSVANPRPKEIHPRKLYFLKRLMKEGVDLDVAARSIGELKRNCDYSLWVNLAGLNQDDWR